MARKSKAEPAQEIEVHTDAGNPSPPAFRPVLPGNIPRIRTAKDARKLFGRLISQFTQGEVSSEDARTLCYLLTGYIQTCATAEIEERLERIEQQQQRQTL